tara:strand:+ start:263 stop:421 length:159 start_codon:yes stop_codon:yes gene_type:complete
MITKKTNGGNMEIQLKYDQLKRQGLPQWQILVRLTKEFGLIRANKWWKAKGL